MSYTYIHEYKYVFTNRFLYIHTCTYISMIIYIDIYMYTHISIMLHVRVFMCVCTCMWSCICVRVFTLLHSYIPSCKYLSCVCVDIIIHTQARVYAYTYMHFYLHMYKYTGARKATHSHSKQCVMAQQNWIIHCTLPPSSGINTTNTNSLFYPKLSIFYQKTEIRPLLMEITTVFWCVYV